MPSRIQRFIALTSFAMLGACALGPRRVVLAAPEPLACSRATVVAKGYSVYEENTAKGSLRAARTRTIGYDQANERVRYEQDFLDVQILQRTSDTLLAVRISSGAGWRDLNNAETGHTTEYRAPTSVVTADGDSVLAQCGRTA